MTVEFNTKLLSDSAIKAQIGSSPGWRHMGQRMYVRSVAICPVSSEPAGAKGTEGPERVGGGLRDSMVLRFTFGSDPTIQIGSGRAVEDGSNLLALVEHGTEPHPISPKQPGGVLVFQSRKWGLVITPNTVHHPGTKANPFVERAMQQIIHESAGATLVAVA